MTYQNGFRVATETAASRGLRACSPVMLLIVLTVGHGAFVAANGQTPKTTAAPPVKKAYTLRITREGIVGVSLKADKARMSEIAADLSKRIGAKVILGPEMQKEALTVDFTDLTFEQAMRLLAPHVYLDYEIRAGIEPKLLGVLLFATNDPAPATNAVVEGSSQAMLIEGNTEDNGQPSDDDPLQVDLDDSDRLTIKSKKQPLVVVVLTIADVLGVPAEIKSDSTEIVDTEIKDIVFPDAITRLSPNIRLYLREDLTLSRKTALRLILDPPPKVAAQ
jgi:hypothetical protein